MNIMGSSGSEHEDESAEWRRSARCRSANANILGASFALSIRGRLRLRRFAASDASIHYFAGQRIYPSRVNRRHKLRVEPQSQNCLDYARQGRATISFNLGCVITKNPREILSLHTYRPCCGCWWTAMGGRKTCVERRFPKRSVALESITRAAGIPHLQELSVLL